MNVETYKTLLKDLQKLEKRIAEAHIAAVRADPAMQAASAKRHAAAEVGGRADDYTAMAARKSAVQFLLRTVYVRVLEDLGALQPTRIRGAWGEEAFRLFAPALGKRAYFAFIFRDLATDFPTLFDAGDEDLGLPSEDLCREAWALWHKEDGRGNLLYDWRPVEAGGTNGGFDSRFLGDLYQDLDGEVRKRFALLQTPHFVESYILDKTLTPALVEFDPEALRAKDETFRVLDPTCGSGHFLIGSWRRLATWWEARGLGRWDAAERALGSVWGSDINAHAVDIARFRLLLEVMAWTGERDLGRLRTLTFNLAVLDSLIPWERGAHAGKQGTLFAGNDLLATYATPTERERNARFLDRSFQVVVGNPPYITPKDRKKREDYPEFWPASCFMNYALSAPFIERFFSLATVAGVVGQITANSFMKRQFGRPVIEKVLANLDLTSIVDTSGAYIPGHGTPTVILIGRARKPESDTVHAILGKRGEPKRPEVPDEGLVWTAIADAIADESPFVTAKYVTRTSFNRHPWSLGGGAAADVRESIEAAATSRLTSIVAEAGLSCITGESVLFEFEPSVPRRIGAPMSVVHQLIRGDALRDYATGDADALLLPNKLATGGPLDTAELGSALNFLVRFKQQLRSRVVSGSTAMEAGGKTWYEARRLSAAKFATPLSLAFALIATHNQVVLGRGREVFHPSAPVLKLVGRADISDHFDVLGALNSSTLCFWMKQVFHCKGSSSGEAIRSEDWEPFWEYVDECVFAHGILLVRLVG